MEQEEHREADADWESRVLCSDGRCTGIIGPDGRCRECGMRYGGTSAADGVPAEAEAGATLSTGAQEAEPPVPVVEEGDPDWESRVLCSDGACIGVIGPDGRCKECGLARQDG